MLPNASSLTLTVALSRSSKLLCSSHPQNRMLSAMPQALLPIT